ncbi:PIN domain-containing protein [Polaribacter sp. R77954]|uniref:PIN domain-containing protein n=1 Tax=Polaribacter sp. R77954 TaxID=3093870 RepID=UPI0037CA0D8F
MENKISLEQIYNIIVSQSKNAKLHIRDFFYLLTVYYQCDIASYTKDAGGYPYLEYLFIYKNGQKVYNEKFKLLEFSSVFQQRYNDLLIKVVKHSEPKPSIDLISKSNLSQKIKVKIIDKIDLSKYEKPKKEIKNNKENLYIIDTNVFVDYPEIISKIDKQYSVVLSAKVTDELDNLKSKLDKNGQRNVQKALRLLNLDNSKRDVRMEMSDISLLPIDFNKHSPDNLILSVALKFKSENPIILTSDNGLQLKAKFLDVTTITLKEFINRKKRF